STVQPTNGLERTPEMARRIKGTEIMGTTTIVKENITSQHALKRLLESQGYSVDIVGDGNGGPQASGNVKPVAIILDLTLPYSDQNGVEGEGDETTPQSPPVLVAVRHSRKSPVDEVLQLGDVSVDFS